MVAIFPKLCLLRRSLCSNLGGIEPEKLYRATLKDLTPGSEFMVLLLTGFSRTLQTAHNLP